MVYDPIFWIKQTELSTHELSKHDFTNRNNEKATQRDYNLGT
jgi:hypothetical protein